MGAQAAECSRITQSVSLSSLPIISATDHHKIQTDGASQNFLEPLDSLGPRGDELRRERRSGICGWLSQLKSLCG